jgi:curved DNA-binding protein CbpA
MTDAYTILGLPADSDDEAIRRRYLELVRQFPPEHHPQKFAEVRAAYEQLKDLNTRLRHRLFEVGKTEGLDAIIEELSCRSPRRRMSLSTLLKITQGH